MSKLFAGFLAATLLVLAVGCSGSDDDALAECISVLVDVGTNHRHASVTIDKGDGIRSNVTMPPQWRFDAGMEYDNDGYGFDIDEVDAYVDEKCAPFLGVSVAEQPAP
jgi:hypothetical protein